MKTECFGFLLLPGYSMLAFSGAVDQLRMANRIRNEKLYRWITISENGQAVEASNGCRVYIDYAMSEVQQLDVLFVCGGIDIDENVSQSVTRWLYQLDSKKTVLGSMCTGTYILARSGLLKNKRCTIHWENMSFLREQYPDLIISHDIFVIDGNRYTCAGGTSSMDMLVAIVARTHGWDLANEIAESFLVERIRGRNDQQRHPLRMELGHTQPKLSTAVSLMEANIEEPLELGEIASHIGVTSRQMERLFKKYLKVTPRRYYMKLRLLRARQLLLQSSMSVYEIALACGFVSGPHFSKCYRSMFGVSASYERIRKPS